MEKKLIHSMIMDQLKSVDQHLSGFKKDKEAEHLHSLRVSIKKVRAIVSFIEDVYNEKIALDPLTLLFKQAGEIRELQINISLLLHLPAPPQTFITRLQNKESRLQQQFMKDIPGHLILVKNIRKSINIDLPLPDKKTIKAYFHRKRGKAERVFSSHKRRSMHHSRKLIKKMLYVHDLLPGSLQKHTGLKKGFIHQLQQELGTWHDTYATIAFLSRRNFKKKATYISQLKKQESKQFHDIIKNYKHLNL